LVCSPEDLLFLRMSSHFDPDGLQFVTPGVRLPQGNTHDQKRVRTPFEAIRDGADYLVAGREVTTSSQPLEVLKRYEEEIERGLEERALAERIISGTT
jgi:orotidine-5'-phosphate decarboxylase